MLVTKSLFDKKSKISQMVITLYKVHYFEL